MNDEYDDDYGTCAETYASLRIIHETLNPDEISRLLGVAPTWTHCKGEPIGPNKRPAHTGVWGLSTEGIVTSRDLRRHLDWLADQVSDKVEALENLRKRDYKTDIYCFWYRSGGSGGPTLSPKNMHQLAILGLEVGIECFDFDGDEENDNSPQSA